MEDGSWVLISNVGGELWNLVSFKLYQICLGAKLNPNFRLDIIFNRFRVENYFLMVFHMIFLMPNLINLKGVAKPLITGSNFALAQISKH